MLLARDVVKSFDGSVALAGASFDLMAGDVHALVGANGAGKSTFSRILSGRIRPDSGTIELAGTPVVFGSARDALRAGIAIVMQETSLVPDLSVLENVFLPEFGRPGRFAHKALSARGLALLTELGQETALGLGAQVRSLTIAQRQLVEIAKALALDSRIIIFDEPTASLSPVETERLFAVIRRLAASGKALIFVSHRLEEIFAVTDRITVFREGKTVAAALVTRDVAPADLVRTMVGYELSNIYAHRAAADSSVVNGAPAVFELEHIAAPPRVRDVSLVVRAGEIVGLAGLVGAGRSECAEAVFGLRAMRAGSVRIGGRPFVPKDPGAAIGAGIGFVPEDRRGAALIPDFDVRENALLAGLGTWRGFGLPYAQRASALRSMLDDLGLSGEDILGKNVLALSGGMQQKIVLARWLLLGPRVLILDEPTRGVDIATRSSIYALLRTVAARGVAVLLISSDFEEVLGLSDRVVVMADGAVVASIPSAFLDVEKLAMFAAPKTSAEGTHRALEELAMRFGGTAFWLFLENSRVYCFDSVGDSADTSPGFGRGDFPLAQDTAIRYALERRAPDFVVDPQTGRATLLEPITGARGHELGYVGLSLAAAAPLPERGAIRRIIDRELAA